MLIFPKKDIITEIETIIYIPIDKINSSTNNKKLSNIKSPFFQ